MFYFNNHYVLHPSSFFLPWSQCCNYLLMKDSMAIYVMISSILIYNWAMNDNNLVSQWQLYDFNYLSDPTMLFTLLLFFLHSKNYLHSNTGGVRVVALSYVIRPDGVVSPKPQPCLQSLSSYTVSPSELWQLS